MTDTNIGKWDRWYNGLTLETPQTYGDSATYEMGAGWLAGCDPIYDLGCGKGGFWSTIRALGMSTMILGVDGSQTPFAGRIVDLATFVDRPAPGVFMRHVLEHDFRWVDILTNAIALFDHRMVLVLFTPLQPETKQIAWNADPGVPDIGFAPADIEWIFDNHGLSYTRGTYKTGTQYGEETVFFVEKS